ncbi:MAG: flagellar biosynthesis anti-sigma factor FlgM [Defluviitaleaceae bacterium]|nr:flagellar biosynthesis anti-sigma factor FlgM [Defluviitaleaceae bacterium]
MDMRISGVYNAYAVQPNRSVAKNANAEYDRENTDTVSLSAQAGEYQLARKAVADVPDIRENLVSHLRAMIASGAYNVSAHDVAARIFEG